MKKLLSVFLAVIMLGSMAAIYGYCANTADTMTFSEIQARSALLEQQANTVGGEVLEPTDPDYVKNVFFVFNFAGNTPGTIYGGEWYKIEGGVNSGYYALLSESYVYSANSTADAPRTVQLPEIVISEENTAGEWEVKSTNNAWKGLSFSSGSTLTITPLDEGTGNYVVFQAKTKTVETQSTLAKIANIFLKVAKVLFGEEVAIKLISVFSELGVDVELS